MWLAMILAGVGQGTPYAAPRLLFPFAMFAACFPKPRCSGYMLAAILQFLVYELLLGTVYRSRRFSFFVLGLIFLHILAAILLAPYDPSS
jgi:hypothetical protein